jgi:hypothetical protein
MRDLGGVKKDWVMEWEGNLGKREFGGFGRGERDHG